MIISFDSYAIDSVSGFECGVTYTDYSGFGASTNQDSARSQSCSILTSNLNSGLNPPLPILGTYVSPFPTCNLTNNFNFTAGAGITCLPSPVCVNGSETTSADSSGNCPSECPSPTTGLEPFDTPECGCSDLDFQAVNFPDLGLVGCSYRPQCPSSGTSAASGCSGRNGVDFPHDICLPIEEPFFCDAQYSNGSIIYSGGRSQQGCVSAILSSTSHYGCDGTETKGDENLDGNDSDDSNTPDDFTDDRGTSDPSDDIQVTRASETTINVDGSTTVTNTTTTTVNGSTTTVETTQTTDGDGNTTTIRETTNPDGTTETDVSGTGVSSDGGAGDCTGTDCGNDDDNSDGSTAGSCGSPPVCTAKPIECAMLRQEYNLQCGVSIESHLNCDSVLLCRGNPLECAAAEQRKQQHCFLTETSDFNESESLLNDQGLYRDSVLGVNGSGDVNVMDSLSIDESGLGWGGSCPAPYSVDIDLYFTSTSFNLTFDKLCNFLIFINPLVLLAAWIAAGMIFFRGITNG